MDIFCSRIEFDYKIRKVQCRMFDESFLFSFAFDLKARKKINKARDACILTKYLFGGKPRHFLVPGAYRTCMNNPFETRRLRNSSA